MMNRVAARVTSDPGIMMGKPVIRNTRIPVELILRRLSAGDSNQEILTDYPRLIINDIRAAQAAKEKGKWLSLEDFTFP